MPDFWHDDWPTRGGGRSSAEWRAAHIEAVTAAARPLDAAVRESYGEPWSGAGTVDVGQTSGRVARFLEILDSLPVERDQTADVVQRAE